MIYRTLIEENLLEEVEDLETKLAETKRNYNDLYESSSKVETQFKKQLAQLQSVIDEFNGNY